MTTTVKAHYIDFSSIDESGEFLFRLYKQRPVQLQLHSGTDKTHINLSIAELVEIRKIIDTVINLHR